ncbi:hypothetical protein OH76DRAFT_1341484, partial [Lentinus brumalis]
DAYRRGLDGLRAAWAAKKYRSHRVLPESLLADLDKAGLGMPGLSVDPGCHSHGPSV